MARILAASVLLPFLFLFAAPLRSQPAPAGPEVEETLSLRLGAAGPAFDIELGGLIETFGDPQVAALAQGSFLVVWHEWFDRYQVLPYFGTRLYDASGRVINARPWPSNGGGGVRLAARPGGGFFITGFAYDFGPGHLEELGSFGQSFDVAGRPLTPSFLLPFTPLAIAVGQGGSLLALTGAPNIALQRFGKRGQPVGSALPVTSSGKSATLAVDSLGRGIVAWSEEGSAGFLHLFVRRVGRGGRWLGEAVAVDPLLERQPAAIALAAAPDGRFVVVWEGSSDGDGVDIFARRFDASGRPLGPVFQVNGVMATDQTAPQVAMLRNGRFLVVWQASPPDVSYYDPRIHGQLYAADGGLLGDETLMSGDDDEGPESGAALSCDTADRCILTWRRPVTLLAAIRGRRFQL